MNIESYNLDSLRKLIRILQAENKELRAVRRVPLRFTESVCL